MPSRSDLFFGSPSPQQPVRPEIFFCALASIDRERLRLRSNRKPAIIRRSRQTRRVPSRLRRLAELDRYRLPAGKKMIDPEKNESPPLSPVTREVLYNKHGGRRRSR